MPPSSAANSIPLSSAARRSSSLPTSRHFSQGSVSPMARDEDRTHFGSSPNSSQCTFGSTGLRCARSDRGQACAPRFEVRPLTGRIADGCERHGRAGRPTCVDIAGVEAVQINRLNVRGTSFQVLAATALILVGAIQPVLAADRKIEPRDDGANRAISLRSMCSAGKFGDALQGAMSFTPPARG